MPATALLLLLLLCSQKGPTPPELTGFWSSLIAEQLTAFPNLDPAAAYLISHGVGHLVLPLLEAYLLIRVMQFAASQVGTHRQQQLPLTSAAASMDSILLCRRVFCMRVHPPLQSWPG
jgi:hypothetical protein